MPKVGPYGACGKDDQLSSIIRQGWYIICILVIQF